MKLFWFYIEESPYVDVVLMSWISVAISDNSHLKALGSLNLGRRFWAPWMDGEGGEI